MLEGVVELLIGSLYRRLDCCSPTSRQRWKLRRRSWKKRKAVLITGAAFLHRCS